MNIHSLYRSGFLLLILLSTACTNNQRESEDPVIARVGNDLLTEEMILDRLPDHFVSFSDTSMLFEKVQSEWIRERLLIQHAADLRIKQLSSYQETLRRYEEELILRLVVEEILRNNPSAFEVSEEEATDFYQKNRSQLAVQEEFIRIRPFTSSSLRDAESARQALLRGQDWNSIVSEYSIRSLEQIEVQSLFIPLSFAFSEVPVLNQIIPKLGVREVSDIVEYNRSFHFVQVLEKKPVGTASELDWILAQIKSWLQEEKKRKYLNSYIRNLYLQSESRNELYIRDVNPL